MGLTHYQGAPCLLGHAGVRTVGNKACIECVRIQGKAHKAQHVDSERERKKAYKLANPDKVKAARARHAARHADALKAKHATYRREDPHGTIAKRREDRAWQAEIRQALKAIEREKTRIARAADSRKRAYLVQSAKRLARTPAQIEAERLRDRVAYAARRKADIEKARLADRRGRSKRRARIRGLDAHASADQVAALLIAQNGHCAYCGSTAWAMHCDHKTAISAGGKDTIDNMQWLCQPCNNRKWTYSDTAYRLANDIPTRTQWDAQLMWDM